MGAVFDRVFRAFAEPSRARADQIYGSATASASHCLKVNARTQLHRGCVVRKIAIVATARDTASDRAGRCRRSGVRDAATAPPAPRCGEMHEPDRLRRRAAAGPGDAGDRDGDVGARMRERACRHGARHLLADRAVPLDQRRRHAEHLGLRRVGIGDEAALDDVRRARRSRSGSRRSGRRCRTRPWRASGRFARQAARSPAASPTSASKSRLMRSARQARRWRSPTRRCLRRGR